jgi:single-strand DNA-binding protein
MANLNLNKVILCGRLTAEPELKTTPSGVSVTSFTIAVNRRFQARNSDGTPTAAQQADFIQCVAWRSTAEFITRYFDKGSSICITGSIQTRSWKDNNGNNRHATEVVADEAMFVDSKSDVGNYDAPAFSSQPTVAPKFEDMKSDDDLPF